MLNRLFDAASRYRTRISLKPVVAAAHWAWPVLDDGGELARIAAASADRGRRLGHLPAA
ncbi:hypothetical protein [Streptomyces lydicus]|uniref:hypothetical protein n=1 Tax=Streptomyces lydicus TaxID=47763 RepID=UPI0013DE6D88|nr:hypothetical protein [Streptomyces lydicus]